MAKQEQAVTTRGPSTALAVVRQDLERMKPQFELMLPRHIPVDRFVRIINSAINRNEKIAACDRRSLLNAASAAAEDGLYPDGRQGAIVPFRKGRDAVDDGTPGGPGDYIATWIPMVRGIRDLVRRSGEIRDLNAQIVYADEEEQGAFLQQLGSNHFIKHTRVAWVGDPAKRPIYGAYSQAWDKTGFELVHEFMSEAELMAVARKSRSFKHGPWSDPLFAIEMRRKTVTRRHWKQLPIAREERLERLFERENDIEERRERPAPRPEQISTFRGGAGAALEHFANGPASSSPKVEPPPADPLKSFAAGDPAPPPGDEPPPIEHFEERDGAPIEHDAGPADAKTAAEYADRFRAYLTTAKTAGAINARWQAERTTRNRLNMDPELRDALDAERKARTAELDK